MVSTATDTVSSIGERLRATRQQTARRLREHIPRRRPANVGLAERIGSGVAGAMLTLLGLALLVRRGSVLGGLGLAATGAGLAYRGTTGHCSAYRALGVTDADASVTSHPFSRFIHVSRRVIINRSPEELYGHWHDFTNLPSIMRHIQRVDVLDNGWSRWVAAAPRGRSVEWTARTTEDRPNELIARRSVDDASVPNHGHVRFQALPHGHGTAVEVSLSYRPPAGVAGALFARIMGEAPQQQLREDLRRFKQFMEAGETATTAGQPHGTCK